MCCRVKKEQGSMSAALVRQRHSRQPISYLVHVLREMLLVKELVPRGRVALHVHLERHRAKLRPERELARS